MASGPRIRLTDIKAAAGRVIEAKAAVRLGIADHAQKHRAAVDEMRKEARRQVAIAEGVKRQNAEIRSTGN